MSISRSQLFFVIRILLTMIIELGGDLLFMVKEMKRLTKKNSHFSGPKKQVTAEFFKYVYRMCI